MNDIIYLLPALMLPIIVSVVELSAKPFLNKMSIILDEKEIDDCTEDIVIPNTTMNALICPQCGAPINNNHCDYCGTNFK